MTISIGPVASNSQAGVTNTPDSELKQLQEALKAINKAIQDELSSKDAAVVKQQKLQALQTELQMIQMKISQAQAKKMKQPNPSHQAVQELHGKSKDQNPNTLALPVDLTGVAAVVDVKA